MTISQQATYHRQYDRWLVQQERKAVRLVLVRMRAMLESVSKALQASTPLITLSMLDMLVSENAHYRMLESVYTQVGIMAAQNQYNRLIPPRKADSTPMLRKDRDAPELPQKPKPPMVIQIDHNSELWRQRMVRIARSSETALRITGMTAKTRQIVRDVLTRGAEEGYTLAKIVRNLRGVIVDKTRAMLIARTETTRAASAGHEAGAESTLLTLNKVWVATADARTRDAHLAMIGSKPVPKDGVFVVGGRNMRYPGDPAGGAANCLNCRCGIAYIPATNIFD